MAALNPIDNNVSRANAAEVQISKTTVWKEKVAKVARRVLEVVSLILIAIAAVFLYFANPSLFAMGFIVGIVMDDKVRETVAKAQRICIAKPWLVLLVVAGSFLAAPVAFASSSFICGAYTSSKISSLVPPSYTPHNGLSKFIKRNLDGIL